MYGYYSWSSSSAVNTPATESQSSEISVDLGQTAGISVDLSQTTSLVAYIADSGNVESSATVATNDVKSQVAKTANDSPYNLLSLLATAQEKEVDFLPITWDEATADRGGQASISQSFFNEKLSYVFKRLHRNFKYPAEEIIALRAVISEVIILGHPEIRGHPNVVRLVGVCFEIDRQTKIPWPVLVFQKAEYGDLKKFMDSPRGRELGLRERLDLCVDIAAAITLMHREGIIHGDIKPENVLVFAEEANDKVKARVTDFGYSTLHASNSTEAQIRLPYSVPWNAPETVSDRDRLFTVHDAKLTDVYSFGMLCIWMIFPNLRDARRISYLKENDRLLQYVQNDIHQMGDIDPLQKKKLSSFFSSTVAYDPRHRPLDLQEAMKEFAQFTVPPLENNGFSTYEMYMPYLSVLPHHKDFDVQKAQSDHYAKSSFSLYDAYYPQQSPFTASGRSHLDIPKSYRQLMGADYRLWGHIFRLVKAKAASSAEDSTPFAFQTAFCYAVGFGTAMDESECESWLQRSGRTWQDLRSEIESLKADLSPMVYKNLETDFSPISYVDYYEETEQLEDVLEVYTATVDSTAKALGDSHPVYLHLNHLRELIILRRGG
ncbi:serine threonine kinase [Trichoderma arundinaceum]|uniref:Serine threonine kinase n=1 Tax=Trichoderma arundinaceum TaxID=490622 RepID=A0A395NGM2_TRIAR|nr:serine threonine kinase [Trichoderma arundinaceum]